MTHLLLVRHGQSEWNAVGRWQGQADPPLTDLGRSNVVLAGRSKLLGAFDAVVSSPLQRAADTATALADAIGVGPVLTDADLMERDAGPWQGHTRDEINEGWPGMLDSGTRPEGYEHDNTLTARVISALSRIESRAGDGTVLVVTHAGVIYALEGACGEPWNRLPNLGGRWLEFSDGNLSLGPRVELVDDAPVPDLL
ncbi:MAG: histidine phosphatase family protein [Acidimicrobiia bacterium]|nr:histidine phosphatase family protein [Actinomycetota bacterium]MBL6925444.1 histidine phosphatase family protein [Acidimicrobiia bacterium]MBL6926715.1 histidine phosphatase family protein [Acidimicrobiia bacterium]